MIKGKWAFHICSECCFWCSPGICKLSDSQYYWALHQACESFVSSDVEVEERQSDEELNKA